MLGNYIFIKPEDISGRFYHNDSVTTCKSVRYIEISAETIKSL